MPNALSPTVLRRLMRYQARLEGAQQLVVVQGHTEARERLRDVRAAGGRL